MAEVRVKAAVCPLYSSLLPLSLLPALRQSEDFQGIERWGRTHKLYLYADDLLLYVSDPLSSVPSILNILAQFGNLSGYKINFEKSEMFPLNQSATSIPPSHFPFRIANKGFKYLGVEITPAFLSLFTKNSNILFEKCKKDFARWINLPLSLA